MVDLRLKKKRGFRGQISGAAHASNRRLVDALTRTSGDGGLVPQMMADAMQSGPQGALEVEDFLEELFRRDQRKGQLIEQRILKLMPAEGTTQSRPSQLEPVPLGGTSRLRPVRTVDLKQSLLATGPTPRLKPSPRTKPTLEHRQRIDPARPRLKPEQVPERRGRSATTGFSQRRTGADEQADRRLAIDVEPVEAMELAETPWSDDFLNEIARRESNVDGYLSEGERNSSTGDQALGRYQMTRIARQEAGLQEGKQWTGRFGVRSREEFLRDPVAQERAMAEFLRKVEGQLKSQSNGSWNKIGTKIMGVKAEIVVTEAGLLAAAHRQGAPTVARYLKDQEQNGWTSDPARWGPEESTRRLQFERVETRLREFEGVGFRRE